jgi:nucleotide-binding universal stress UspA family protein/RimJ/RimL family protein N-acetyltransferase
VPEEVVRDKLTTRRILVPLDGSKLAESVLPHVEMLAKQRGVEKVEVTLLRVCKPSIISFDYEESGVPASRKEHAKQELADCKRTSERYFARVKRRLERSGIKVRSVVLEGEPADEIIEYANENIFNLIVMASHGRSGISRWAYGSVAGKVLLGVSSPIFLVRPAKPSRGELEKYRTTVKLRDGSLMRLRPIKPSDEKKLLSLFYRLSPDTVYLRFHNPLTQMSKKEVRRFCTVDYDDSFALVATTGEGRKERIVGVIRYYRLPPGDAAETGIVVEDSYQGKGIGTHLIKQIAAIAGEKGIRRLQGEVLPGNQAVMRLVKNSGFKVGRELDSGVYRVVLHVG